MNKKLPLSNKLGLIFVYAASLGILILSIIDKEKLIIIVALSVTFGIVNGIYLTSLLIERGNKDE
jgi:hypothetical protein